MNTNEMNVWIAAMGGLLAVTLLIYCIIVAGRIHRTIVIREYLEDRKKAEEMQRHRQVFRHDSAGFSFTRQLTAGSAAIETVGVPYAVIKQVTTNHHLHQINEESKKICLPGGREISCVDHQIVVEIEYLDGTTRTFENVFAGETHG
jgi:hypothetical protein